MYLNDHLVVEFVTLYEFDLYNEIIVTCANVADAPRIQIVNTLKKTEETEA